MKRSNLVLLACLLLSVASPTDAVTADDRDTVTTTPSRPSATPSPLYLLTYDHGGLVLWGREHFADRLKSAVAWLDRYPSFKIGLDNEAYTYDKLAEEDPALLEEIRRYLRNYRGRFGIGTCTYGQPLSVFVNEESNIRQIGFALAADRDHFGCAPNVYLMSEHAMHSQMPQILNGFGFAGAIMRTHYMMYGYNPTFDAAIGWWIGLDNSRISTIPTYKGQGAQFGRTTVDNWILTRYPGDNAPKSLADFKSEFSHIQPLLATRADDAGLRKEALVKEYEGKPGYEWILLEEILPNFPTPEKEFRTASNDFVVRMPWGYCGNEIWDTSRRAEIAVLTAERLAAIERMVGGQDHRRELEQAWKNLLVAQHHDIQICGLLSDARTFLPKSIDTSENVTKASLKFLASRMSGDKPQVVVFNPVSWPRKDWVQVPMSLSRGWARRLEVRHDDRIVPSAILSADLHSDGSLRDISLGIQADLPGLSVASYALAPADGDSAAEAGTLEIDSENLSITTPHFEVRFHHDGGLSSLVDKRAGGELIRTGKRSAFFAGRIDGQDVQSKGTWVLRRAQGEAPWALACENGFVGSIPYTFRMEIHSDSPRIDCWVRFHFAGQKIGRVSTDTRDPVSGFVHEDKLRFKMFPAVENGEAVGVRDLPFAVSETADRYINGLYWTALADGDNGIAFFNRGTMGAVREEDGGFSMPLAYAMYYVWGTRMLTGDFTYEFAIRPFTGSWRRTDLHRDAIEYNYQPVGLYAEAGGGEYGPTIQPITMSSSAPIVSAFYNSGNDFYVRLYEHEGHTRQVTLGSPVGEAHLTEVDLAGRELGAISGPFDLRAWQIKTVRLRLNNH